MKAFITILCLITLPVLIESCCLPGSCCGDSDEGFKYSIVNMGMSVGMKMTFPHAPLPAETKPELIDFRFNFDVDLVSNSEIFKPTMAAYACSPSRRESIEKITSVSIKSNNAMVTDKGVFDAGDELYKIFGTTYDALPTPIYDLYLSLMPSFKMIEASEHAFTVIITLDDGRTFEFESDSYQFVP